MFKKIKTLYELITNLINRPEKILHWKFIDHLPTRPMPPIKTSLLLYSLKNQIKKDGATKSIGNFFVEPHPITQKIWSDLIKYNPNNLGNWSLDNNEATGTQLAEKKLISMLIRLFGGNKNEWEGYVTSGGTEANIFSLWAIRNKLLKKSPKDKICVIKNSFTHYSITKAADLVGLPIFDSNLSEDTWVHSSDNLRSVILDLTSKGYKCFIIPLTLGYTQTGLNDDIVNIKKELKKLMRENNVIIEYFVDAAFNGLVLPFTKNNFKPLNDMDISCFSVDFHKSGMTPLGCGVLMYKKSLRKHIEHGIPYLRERDSTLLGSRSGLHSLGAYFVMLAMGQAGFTKRLLSLQKKRDVFIKYIQTNFPDVKILSDVSGISIGLASFKKLPKEVQDKYGIYSKSCILEFPGRTVRYYVYKIAFLQ